MSASSHCTTHTATNTICPAVALRSYPSGVGRVTANLPDGAALTIYGEWQGWYVVRYGDLMGYAAAAYIDTP